MRTIRIDDELKAVASTLADWLPPRTQTVIYLYGSRVRGDHRADSDVDIFVAIDYSSSVDVLWWQKNNFEEFVSIKALLPGRLEILEFDDPLKDKIIEAGKNAVHRERNVVCVSLPSAKPTRD